MPYAVQSAADIAAVQLCYREGSEVYAPWYRFWVKLPEEAQQNCAEGCTVYGAYYVPAVSGDFAAGMPGRPVELLCARRAGQPLGGPPARAPHGQVVPEKIQCPAASAAGYCFFWFQKPPAEPAEVACKEAFAFSIERSRTLTGKCR